MKRCGEMTSIADLVLASLVIFITIISDQVGCDEVSKVQNQITDSDWEIVYNEDTGRYKSRVLVRRDVSNYEDNSFRIQEDEFNGKIIHLSVIDILVNYLLLILVSCLTCMICFSLHQAIRI